jgi:hypothetical protein
MHEFTGIYDQVVKAVNYSIQREHDERLLTEK